MKKDKHADNKKGKNKEQHKDEDKRDRERDIPIQRERPGDLESSGRASWNKPCIEPK